MTIYRNIMAFIVPTLLLLFIGCNDKNDGIQMSSAPTSTYKLSMNLTGTQTNALTQGEGFVEKLDLYSFAKDPVDGYYKYETTLNSLPFTTEADALTSEFSFDGTLQRKLYFIANKKGEAPLLDMLSPALTHMEFELLLLLAETKLQAPFVMVSKYDVTTPTPNLNIEVDLNISAVRLDVINKYRNFVIDSMILKNVVGGTYLFNNTIPVADQVPLIDMKYESVDQPIYLYPSDKLVLAVYGKYKGIRVAFDVQIPPLVAATRYNLTIKSSNTDDAFNENVEFKIAPWVPGKGVESTPDWKIN